MKFFRNWGQPPFLKDIAEVFSRRVRSFGETPAGVLWKNSEGQQLRFEILAGILGDIQNPQPVSICDFGCGYGAYYTFLKKLKMKKPFRYFGIDISEEMIKKCESRIKDPNARFTQALIAHQSADYTIASGTYSMMSDTPIKDWEDYIRASLVDLWMQTRKGLGFNILNAGSMPADSALYTATSGPYVEFCKQELSPNVQLLNDYHPDEWTIFVRR